MATYHWLLWSPTIGYYGHLPLVTMVTYHWLPWHTYILLGKSITNITFDTPSVLFFFKSLIFVSRAHFSAELSYKNMIQRKVTQMMINSSFPVKHLSTILLLLLLNTYQIWRYSSADSFIQHKPILLEYKEKSFIIITTTSTYQYITLFNSIFFFFSIHAFISDKSPYYTGYINYNQQIVSNRKAKCHISCYERTMEISRCCFLVPSLS